MRPRSRLVSGRVSLPVDLCVLVRGAPSGPAYALYRLRRRDGDRARTRVRDGRSGVASRFAIMIWVATSMLRTTKNRNMKRFFGVTHAIVRSPKGATSAPDETHHGRKGAKGAVLPVVLLISSMMLATSAAWFETSLAAARRAANMRDHLQAFHAADAGLVLCSRAVSAGAAPVVQTPSAEPGDRQPGRASPCSRRRRPHWRRGGQDRPVLPSASSKHGVWRRVRRRKPF